ncbi:uncharacterized protein LOC143916591 [Arctopsyche grandis]|uniref:uncharacterized protein LOC143916591 n=1 Tax=Arctopsyche grandis TaxID=121162 RepID=UPI00406D9345
MVECRWLGIRLCSEGLWMRQCVAGSWFGYVQKVSGCGSVLLARGSAMFRRSLDAAVCCWLVVRLCSEEGLWCGSVLLARCSAMFGRSLDTAVCCWLVRLVDLPSPRSVVVAGQELDVDWSAAVCRRLLLWVDWRCLGCTSVYSVSGIA